MGAESLVIVGRLRRAHGIRGELVVEPITSEPAALFSAGRSLFVGDASGDALDDGVMLTVEGARPQPHGLWLVRFTEIHDRTEAERWRGRHLLAPDDSLTPLADGEVYVHELPGMQTVLDDAPFGPVTDVYELPQGLTLEIVHRGQKVLLPFSEAFVRRVDRDARTIAIVLPDGLLD